jgi:hypothetical protein
MVMIIDPLATRLNQDFQAERERLLGNAPAVTNGVWLSQGDLQADRATKSAPLPDENSRMAQAIIHGRQVIGRGQALEGVTFWYFRPGPGGTADRVFTHRIDAERAELTPGFWQLTGVVENRLGGDVRRTPISPCRPTCAATRC